MNSRELARYLVLGGVLAGLTAGTELRANNSNNPLAADKISVGEKAKCSGPNGCGADKKASDKKAEDKNACAGLNGCKGKGNCKSGDNGCAGKNSCKGKGGCASKEYHHECSGKNACKGQGPGGKNECKGQGACAVPSKPAE